MCMINLFNHTDSRSVSFKDMKQYQFYVCGDIGASLCYRIGNKLIEFNKSGTISLHNDRGVRKDAAFRPVKDVKIDINYWI